MKIMLQWYRVIWFEETVDCVEWVFIFIFLTGDGYWTSLLLLFCGRIARRVREETERLGVSVGEYLVEPLSRNFDPEDRAVGVHEEDG